MPTLLELADAPIDGLDGDRCSRSLPEEERGPAAVIRTDKGALVAAGAAGATVEARRRPRVGRRGRRTGSTSTRASARPRGRAPELRERLYAELESVSRQALSAEEEALVEQRLSDLGYL